VLEGRLDVAFVTGQPTAPGCQCLPLWNERLYVAVPLDHGLSSTGEVEWSQLRNERFFVTMSGRGPEIEDLLLSRLAGPGFRPDIQVHAVSRETILHMVELHFGLGVVTETAVIPNAERVRFLRLVDGDHTVESSAIWLKSNTNPTLPALMELASQLQSEDGE
jgi:DNA-binding transcriptional LysR family regulator